MLAVGTSVVFDEPAERVRLAAAVSTSPMVKVRAAVGVSSLVARSAMSVIVGTSLTALTVKTKVSLLLAVPSLTVTVMVAVPDRLAAGVTVMVRLAPEPPKTMLAVGTSVVLDEIG